MIQKSNPDQLHPLVHSWYSASFPVGLTFGYLLVDYPLVAAMGFFVYVLVGIVLLYCID